jgi:hypothetical protein
MGRLQDSLKDERKDSVVQHQHETPQSALLLLLHVFLQLNGEDPDAIPDEPLPKRQHADSPEQRHRQHDQPAEQQPAAAGDARGAGSGRLADAWQMPGSLFSLLTSAEATAGAAAAADKDGKKKHKEHKHKKEKHKKKDKVCFDCAVVIAGFRLCLSC